MLIKNKCNVYIVEDDIPTALASDIFQTKPEESVRSQLMGY